MTNLEELRAQLGDNLNITRVVELKPYSALLVVVRLQDDQLTATEFEKDYLAHCILERLKRLLDGQRCEVLISNTDIELDFYRIDPNG